MDLKKLADTPPWKWPEGAAKKISAILRDDRADESERLLAAELTGELTVINDDLADSLLSIARSVDHPANLRGAAILSLGPVLEYADMDEFEDPDDVPISEETFRGIRESLRDLYMDAGVPLEVRRHILEASVRAPQDWHQNAIRAAYFSGDESWKLTAVFCMRFVQGFDEQILEALASENQDIQYHAVCAAGNWGIDAAWPNIVALVHSDGADKHLRLAAIDAIAGIRPQEAWEILDDLTVSEDEDIVKAACEAIAMAKVLLDEEYGDEDDEFFR